MPWLFTLVLAVHVGAGAVALTSFWGAIVTVKGGPAHRRWGRAFASAIYTAGFMALAMGLLSLVWPLAMHSQLTDATLYRGMFGTMMVYLGLLVLSMTRYGLMMVANRRNHDANRHWSMLALQGGTLVGASICLTHGIWLLNRNGIIMETVLMILVALLGFGTTLTYFRYIFAPPASPRAYIAEHLKAMVATGIAAYTAFLSVGLVDMFPEHAFNPLIWAVPTVIGMGLIIHFLRRSAGSPEPASASRGNAAKARPQAPGRAP